MAMANALFRLLKSRDPERAIDVLAPEWSLPIVARMPEIRAGIAAETGHGELGLGKRRRIAAGLRDKDYDRAIVLPRSFKSALIPWLARIPVRTAFRGEMRYGLVNDMRPLDKSVLDQVFKRYLALGLDRDEALPDVLPFPRLAVSDENQARVIEELGVRTDRAVIALMPGAEYGPSKRWPQQHFTRLARALDEAGYAVWVLGSDKEAPAGEAIAAGSAARNLCGKTSLADVIDLLAACEQVVANDSGLLHVASAVGPHVHGIYGATSSKFAPPLAKSHDIHEVSLDCRPCRKPDCPLGHLKCLRDLQPEGIFQKITEKSG